MYRGGVGQVKLAGATSCCKPPGTKNIFYNEVDSYWFFRMKMSFGATKGGLGDLAGAYFREEVSGPNLATGFAMKREF